MSTPMSQPSEKSMFDFFMGDPERKRQIQELYHAHAGTAQAASRGGKPGQPSMSGSPRKFKSTSTSSGKGVMGLDTGETNEGTDDEVARAFGFHKRPPRTEPVQIYITQPMMETPPQILYNIRNGIFEDVAKREEEEWKPKKLAAVGDFFASSIARATGNGRGRGGAAVRGGPRGGGRGPPDAGRGRGRGRPPKSPRPESPPPPPMDEDEDEANFAPGMGFPSPPFQAMSARSMMMPQGLFGFPSPSDQQMNPDEFLRMFAPPTSPRSARAPQAGRGRGRGRGQPF